MELEQIRATLDNDDAVGTKFKVTGYTDSDGNKRDVTFEVVGREGKKEMQEASLNQLRFNQFKQTPIDGATDDLWQKATSEVERSIRKSLNGENTAWAARSATNKKDSDAVYITHLKELDRTNEIVNKTKNSATKTKVKSSITNQLPIGSYVYNIKLQPGKYDKLEIL